MRVKIQSCARDLRETRDGRSYSGIKFDGRWYNIPGDHRKLYGKTVDLEINGSWARLARPTTDYTANKHAGAPDAGPSIAWYDYRLIVSQLHDLANSLEPDTTTTDRSAARAALVESLLKAVMQGRQVELPQLESSPSDEIPWEDERKGYPDKAGLRSIR